MALSKITDQDFLKMIFLRSANKYIKASAQRNIRDKEFLKAAR